MLKYLVSILGLRASALNRNLERADIAISEYTSVTLSLRMAAFVRPWLFIHARTCVVRNILCESMDMPVDCDHLLSYHAWIVDFIIS